MELVQEDIGRNVQRITFDEERVVAELLKQKQTSSSKQHQAESKELKSLEKRLGDLEKLIRKSYEELMLGDIPRETVLEMINKYKKEQTEIEERANSLRENLTIAEETETDVREWVEMMKKYVNVEELDRELLLKLVDKIVAGQKQEVDGVQRQEITIYYNLVGQVNG